MLGYRWLLGRAFTYLLTLAGTPSVPGARSYPERYPLTVDAWLPRIAVSARTPLADGNIAIFTDRWKLIDTDTLPAYLTLLRDHPDRARALVATPLPQRVTRYRLLVRGSQLTAAALTRWDVKLQAAPGPRTCGGRLTKPSQTATTVIDLTSTPTRESAGFAAAAGSRVWMDARRAPSAITVTLPGGRAYQAHAQMAAMLASAPAGNPDRLTVQLPPAGLNATAQLLSHYAAQWGFPASAVTAWQTSTSRHAPGDRHYSTHVFTAEPTGYAHLEFQVSHHVRERDYIVTAMFSWPASHAA
jgi:hypothetical protein